MDIHLYGPHLNNITTLAMQMAYRRRYQFIYIWLLTENIRLIDGPVDVAAVLFWKNVNVVIYMCP